LSPALPSAGPKQIGALTSGSDCAGLNAVTGSFVRQKLQVCAAQGFGFLDRWRGVIDNDGEELDIGQLRGTLPGCGTLICTSRVTRYMVEDSPAQVRTTIKAIEPRALKVVGGEDMANVVGVPKTFDNHVSGTEGTFCFDSAWLQSTLCTTMDTATW